MSHFIQKILYIPENLMLDDERISY